MVFFCLLKEKPVKEHRRFAATQIFLNGYKYFSRKGQSDSLGNELYKFRNSKKRFFFFIFCYISLYTACGLVLDLILKKKRCYSEYRFLIVLHDAMASYLIGNSNPGKCTNKYIGTICLRLRAVENHGRLCQLTRRMLLMKIKKIK